MTDWSPAFLSRLVHELRTPLASMRIAAEMLADDPRVPGSLAGTTGRLCRAVADLDELLDQLGEINRIRAGRTPPVAQPVDVSSLLAAVARATMDDVSGAGATLSVRQAPSEPSPTSDAKLLARALECLVRSACACGARRLELASVADPTAVAFELRDDGPEPTPDEQERLFEPLTAHARTRRVHGGSGLGLPLAHAIASVLGGELTARVEATQTVLRLRLRLHP